MKRFEYKVVSVGSIWKTLDTDKLEEELNILGSQGWELVTKVARSGGSGSTGLIMIFKRPRS